MRHHLAILALLATGCQPWDRWPDGSGYLDDSLWDNDIVAAADGLYVRLPHAGELVRVKDSGEASVVDLDGAEPIRLVETPDSSRVLAFARWPVCADDDDKIETVDDCPDDDLSWEYELDIVSDGERQAPANIPSHLNSIVFSDDGSTAVAWLDYQSGQDLPTDALIDLSSVAFIDLTSSDPETNARTVSVGFSPSNVLFSEDGSKALVLSRSQAVVVDLEDFSPSVTFPLTMDADQEIDTLAAELVTYTDDEGDVHNYALITVVGQGYIYKLDLEVGAESIDIITLAATPSDMAVSTAYDRTAVVYSGKARVDLVSHANFTDIETVELDDPANSVLLTETSAVLFNTSSSTHDIYRVDLQTSELTEYVVENPVASLVINESGTHAVAILEPENSGGSGLDAYMDARWGLGIVDLQTDESTSLAFEGKPVGMALTEGTNAYGEATTFALILIEGYDSLLQVDLGQPTPALQIALDAPPVGIGAMPEDDRFYITHDAALGLVSFLDPTTGELTTVNGFASVGLMTDDELPRREGN